MNKKHLILSMALAGACFQTGSLFAQQADSRSYLRSTSVARIGDGASRIGDSDGASDALGTSQDVRPTEFRTNLVDTALPSDPLPPDSTYTRPVSYASESYGSDGSCAPCESSSCISMACPSPCVEGSNSWWAEGGALLWWSGERRTPPLVTRHANAGGLPVLGDPDTQVLAGGEEKVGAGLLPGFYAGFGTWLDSSQCTGVSARAFGLFGDSSSETYRFDGVRSQGVPFFDTSLGAQNAYLVGFNAGGLGVNTPGTITVSSDLDLIGAEALLRRAIFKNGSNRMDFVGGYLFAKLDDSLILNTQYTDGITNAVANGTVISTLDQFSGSNTFHGGQLGLLSEVATGKWKISSGAKFGLGNMHQSKAVSGIYTEVPPAVVGPTFQEPRGLLVQSSNRGAAERNVFAFIPQIDLKLGYQVQSNLRFDVGYSLMYFSNVVLGGNQIDSNIDIANIFANPAAPTSRFESDSLILHGINLGGTFTF